MVEEQCRESNGDKQRDKGLEHQMERERERERLFFFWLVLEKRTEYNK